MAGFRFPCWPAPRRCAGGHWRRMAQTCRRPRGSSRRRARWSRSARPMISSFNQPRQAICVWLQLRGNDMPAVPLIEESAATAEVRAVFDDIKATRNTDWINNFWKALANDPATLRRTWESLKEVMAPGALNPLTKELIYLAVSVTNSCGYCMASHGAAAKRLGMTKEMFAELIAVVGMANETNRLADGYRVPVDERFENLF